MKAEDFILLQPETLDYDLACMRYQSLSPAGNDQYLLAPPNLGQFEITDVRKYLAEHEKCFVIKTHLLPYDHYFEGEVIVQPLRHPGASTWSYFHFLNDVIGHEISQEDVIRGAATFGSWAEFHTIWGRTADEMGDRMMRVTYESLFKDEVGCSQRLAAMTGLPILSDKTVPFSYYHKKHPLLARSGSPDEWAKHFDDAQFDLLIEHHGHQMERLGYSTHRGT